MKAVARNAAADSLRQLDEFRYVTQSRMRRGYSISASISLAVLEYTVNYRRRGWVPATVVGRAMIPASVRVATVSIDKLPANRFIASPPPELQVLGGDWLERGTTAVLKVPSVIVTEEWNYPLNPLHADFLKLRISAPQPFNFSSSPRQGARLGTTGHSTI